MGCLISVIVPVYNVEKFLPRCIESIRAQTYKKIEIILVDDGSPDQCPKICDNYAKDDDRIKVIHKKNGGLSDARNMGIECAKGEYLCFVDSDDYIAPTMLEHLLNAIQENKTKLAICNFQVVDEYGQRVFEEERSPIVKGCFSAQKLLPKLYNDLGWYYVVAWNKIYHRSLFDTIRFPQGKIHEDEYIIAQIIYEAQNISCIDSEEYIYTYNRKGSIMTERQVQGYSDWLEALYERYVFCTKNNESKQMAHITRAVYFRELNKLFFDKDIYNKMSTEQFKKAKRQYDIMQEKTLTETINWFLFRIDPRIYRITVRLIRRIRGENSKEKNERNESK